MTDLHTETYGTGEPALLVHGSGSWGIDSFGRQCALADEFRLNLIDRRGYGQSPAVSVIGWPTDVGDVADLLTELGAAHLVGHSSGGTVALLRVTGWQPGPCLDYRLRPGSPARDRSVRGP